MQASTGVPVTTDDDPAYVSFNQVCILFKPINYPLVHSIEGAYVDFHLLFLFGYNGELSQGEPESFCACVCECELIKAVIRIF